MRHSHFNVFGPTADRAVVEAWADDYIRFERRAHWQELLRSELRNRCRQLEPSQGEVLHAIFFGAKLANADVENLAVYNIDSFRIAGRNGIRFEHGAPARAPHDGVDYPFRYRYTLAMRSSSFIHWQPGRTLASFGWTDLGAFRGEKKLAQVWLALSRGESTVFDPVVPNSPFSVSVRVRPPHRRQPVWGALLKSILDGVICAFQSHTDTSVLPEVSARLAEVLSVDPAEIELRLLNQHRAVLGAVQRLASPYRNGVKWDPSDHRCVAGELVATEPIDDRWAISGELVELRR